MGLRLPAVVGYCTSAQSDALPALLLDWKAFKDARGHRQWFGLIAFARQHQSHAAIPWSMTVEWVPASALQTPPPETIWTGRAR